MKHPSERSDFADFPELGMDSNEWHSEMARDGGPLAPWTDPGAWGETFEVVSVTATELPSVRILQLTPRT